MNVFVCVCVGLRVCMVDWSFVWLRLCFVCVHVCLVVCVGARLVVVCDRLFVCVWLVD